MAYFAIAFIAPNYRDYKNQWLKAYEPGTTTPKSMALDSAAAVTVAKLQLNADGFLKSAGDALVIPYIDGAYDLWLFPTSAEADANDTSSAVRVADDINSTNLSLINDLSVAYEFATVAAYKASTIVFPVGKIINLLDRGASFTVIAGTGTANNYNIIENTTTAQSLSLIGLFTMKRLGVLPNVDMTTDYNAIIDIMIARGTIMGSRVQVESLGFEDGHYIQNGEVNFKSIRDFRFYAVSGGKGSVVIDVTGATVSTNSYIADNAAFGQFSNLVWEGLVDNDTNFVAIGSDTSLVRGWDFYGCDVIAIKRCFRVSGTLLCSEFAFYDCDFLQCHTFMYNSNTQAVNWTTSNCNWENDSLVFAGDNAESTLLFADKGTFLTWNGGSIIPQGGLVFCNWTAAGDAFRASHKVVFDKVRVEVFPTTGSTNPPLVDRTTIGYINGSNSMPVSFTNCSGLIRGGVASPYVWANVWNRSSLTVDATEFADGEIHGIYDANTEASAGELIINNNVALTYVDDSAGAKTAAYVNHFIKITHDASQDSDGYDIDQRNATTIGSSREKIVRVRGATGRAPLAGTETVLPVLPKNATVLSIGYRRLQVANTGQSFTAELRSSDGVTLYATVTLANNERTSDSVVLLESGIDIVTDLKVVFTGTAELVTGYFELRYI